MNYSVLFKTHVWNSTTQELYRLLCNRVNKGDVFILIDSDSSNFPDPEGAAVVRYGQKNLRPYGIGDTGSFWSNGDYQTILFWLEHNHYDYYVSLEYDVAVGIDVDLIVMSMEENNIDSLYHPIPEDVSHWPHLGSCIDFYNFHDIKPSLFCISFFSRAAVAALYARRLNQVRQKKILQTQLFPLGEVVMGSEAGISGLREELLENYCKNLDHYRWDRAFALSMITEEMLDGSIIHPVASLEKVFTSNISAHIRQLDAHILRVAETIRQAHFYRRIHEFPDNTAEQKDAIIRSAETHLDRSFYNAYFKSSDSPVDAECFQSSTSEYSKGETESALIFLKRPEGPFRIHTDAENDPFWGVRFIEPVFVNTVYIFDRADMRRYYSYEVRIRYDGHENVIYASPNEEYLGGIFDGPKVIPVNRKIIELKISVRGHGMLHLDAVQFDFTSPENSSFL